MKSFLTEGVVFVFAPFVGGGQVEEWTTANSVRPCRVLLTTGTPGIRRPVGRFRGRRHAGAADQRKAIREGRVGDWRGGGDRR